MQRVTVRQAVLWLLGMLIAMPVVAQIKEPEPDYQAMRRYRISQFSEENLNKFHADGEGLLSGIKFEPMLPTVAQRYEQKVMGICNYAFKMEDAIKWHCLPG